MVGADISPAPQPVSYCRLTVITLCFFVRSVLCLVGVVHLYFVVRLSLLGIAKTNTLVVILVVAS